MHKLEILVCNAANCRPVKAADDVFKICQVYAYVSKPSQEIYIFFLKIVNTINIYIYINSLHG